ncbi:hypothetical protein [Niabella soli]|uniref:Low-complexity protein n=1 Tax=Niabella soli DSM 19437 TaxID=929713 RepID=W0F377_9BACT|nr:hypothetical protein [Niabella soli]AHF17500.1 hypothetical protein NIASO_08870 [Niabella soli DSM 19437]
MEKKKSIVKGSLLTGAIIAAAGFSANANGLFNYSSLGTGAEMRTNLLEKKGAAKNFELKCGGDKAKSDSTMKKGKEGKCGDGKCGDGKCGSKTGKKSMKKKDTTTKPKDGQ